MTLGARFVAYDPAGERRGILPFPLAATATDVLNDISSGSIDYLLDAPRSELLDGLCEIAAEVNDGTGWREFGARMMRLKRGGSQVDETRTRRYALHSYGRQLEKMRMLREETLSTDGERVMLGMTAGGMIKTLFDEAQARGNATAFEYDFTASVDSAGQAWGGTLPPQALRYGDDLLGLLRRMADNGACDWKVEGRTLRLFKPDTLGVDKSATVRLFNGTDIYEAPDDEDATEMAGRIGVIGDEGRTYEAISPSLNPWGLWEETVNAAGVKDIGGLQFIGEAEQRRRSAPRVQMTRKIRTTDVRFAPIFAYEVGDTILIPDQDGEPTAARVRELQLAVTAEGVGVNGTFNDRILERDLRDRRTWQGMLGGASGSAGGSGVPSLNDAKRKPAVPAGLVCTSVHSWGADGAPFAIVDAAFEPVDEGEDGRSIGVSKHELYGRRNVSGEVWRKITEGDGSSGRVTYSPLPVAQQWQFKVRAISQDGVAGDFSAPVTVMLSADVAAPGRPSTPTAVARLGQIAVSWDGLIQGGGSQPVDYAGTDVLMATTAAGVGVVVGQVTPGGTLVVTDQPYGEQRWFGLVSFDRSGNRSVESARVVAAARPVAEIDLDDEVSEKISDALALGTDLEVVRATADGKNRIYVSFDEPTGDTTNLAANASFEMPASQVEVRRNLLLNPDMVRSAGGWVVQTTGAWSDGDTLDAAPAAIVTAGTGVNLFIGLAPAPIGTIPASRFTVAAFSSAEVGKTIGFRHWDGTSFTEFGSVTLTLAPQEVSLPASRATTSSDLRLYIFKTGDSLAEGQKLRVSRPIVEAVTVGQTAGVPFSGTRSPDPALTPSFTAAANASPSILSGVSPLYASNYAPSTMPAYQTRDRPAVGDFAARYTAISAGALAIPLTGNFPVLTDRDYTLVVRVRPNDRDEYARIRIGSNNSGVQTILPRGEWTEFRATQRPASGGITATTGLYVYANAPRAFGETIDVDALVIAEGVYDGPFVQRFSQGDLWFEVDSSGAVVGIKVWNGAAFVPQVLYASDVFASGSITAPLFQANSVETEALAAHAVTFDKLAVGAVKAESIDVDALNGKTIEGGTLIGGDYWSEAAWEWYQEFVDAVNNGLPLPTPRGLILSGNTIVVYDGSSEDPFFTVSATTGEGSIRGTFSSKASDSDARVDIGTRSGDGALPRSTVAFYPAVPNGNYTPAVVQSADDEGLSAFSGRRSNGGYFSSMQLSPSSFNLFMRTQTDSGGTRTSGPIVAGVYGASGGGGVIRLTGSLTSGHAAEETFNVQRMIPSTNTNVSSVVTYEAPTPTGIRQPFVSPIAPSDNTGVSVWTYDESASGCTVRMRRTGTGTGGWRMFALRAYGW